MADFYNSSSNTVISGTAENDSIYSEIDLFDVTINSYAGDDNIENYSYSSAINAGDGNNTIYNRGYYVTITSGSGNDSIWTDVDPDYGSEHFRNVTVHAGAGNDTLMVNDHETYLEAGIGDDIVSVYGGRSDYGWSTNTLEGGQGNDTMYGGNKNVFPYVEGDGDDIIYNFADGDTLKIEPNEYTSYISGDDMIINTAGDGHITLVGAADKNIFVNDENINPISDDNLDMVMQLSRWSYNFNFPDNSSNVVTFSGS